MRSFSTAATRDGQRDARHRHVLTIFVGLMLGMLIASLSQTIVAPAMPRIVAELGGVEHYSWVAISAMLAATVVVPIVGKLSDLYGRKPFFVGGIVIFLVGSVLSGLVPDFTSLIITRVVQGAGMGIMLPLSQAIVGDIIPPRQLGKYQGLLGGVFGLSSIAGPLAGGYITDHFTWRWLFFVNVPFCLLALAFIIPFMRLPHEKRPHSVDYWGMVTLSLGLTTALMATVWGGNQYPWASAQIVGLYALAGVFLFAFVRFERRAQEPVLPLHLWRNRVFTYSNIANASVAMGMFGAIFFIPLFVQGVIGNDATSSGAIMVPMSVAMIGMSIVNGLIVSHTGRYKVPILAGLVVMGLGFWLLTQMDASTTNEVIVRNMIILGLGLGASLQTFTLVVQNAVSRENLGVATAATQLFRSVGATVGLAVMGTVMSQSMAYELPRHLPQAAAAATSGQLAKSAGALLDPAVLAALPPQVVEGIRAGLAASLHQTFVAGLPFVALALVAALLIPELPLRLRAHADSAPPTTTRAGTRTSIPAEGD